MKKSVVYVLCLVLVLGVVMGAESDWGKINTVKGINVTVNNESRDNTTSQTGEGFGDSVHTGLVNTTSADSSFGGGTYFTVDFYIAMGLIFIFLLVLGFFIWLWLRGSKNKWE